MSDSDEDRDVGGDMSPERGTEEESQGLISGVARHEHGGMGVRHPALNSAIASVNRLLGLTGQNQALDANVEIDLEAGNAGSGGQLGAVDTNIDIDMPGQIDMSPSLFTARAMSI